jgi:hypothetical protein
LGGHEKTNYLNPSISIISEFKGLASDPFGNLRINVDLFTEKPYKIPKKLLY